MEKNLFKSKPYDESLGFSLLVDLYNQFTNYLNPEKVLQVTEELARLMIGAKTVLSRNFLTFENNQGDIVGFTGLITTPIYKATHVALYSIIPTYIDSGLPEELIDTTLDLKKKLKISEALFQTFGEISAPFDNKLESLGFSPVNYTWSMSLDNFKLFSHPGVPKGIKIQNLKQIDDFTSVVNVLNEAFADSFKFEPFTKIKWKKMMHVFHKNHIGEHCMAYDNEKLIGICDAFLNPEQDQTGLIANFGVLPSYQHRKIGSALLASAIETLREKGCTKIKLGVDTENEKALGLYKKFGFYVRKNLTQRTYQIID